MDHSLHFVSWQNCGKTIRATLMLSERQDVPLVIMVHGFTSHRIGPGYFFTSIARYCAGHGINALAFDCTGCGESDGLFSDVSISSMGADLQSAYSFVKQMYNPSGIFLLGHSFGGTVVALNAHRLPNSGLILISPLADTAKHARQHEYVMKNGMNPHGNYEFGPHEIGAAFLDELKACKPVDALTNKSTNAMLLFQGSSDTQVTIDEAESYIAKARESGIAGTNHIVANADHRFSTVQSRKMVENTLVRWIKERIL